MPSVRSVALVLRAHPLAWLALLVAPIAIGRLVFALLNTTTPYWQADFVAYWSAAQRLLAGQSVFQSFQLSGAYPAVGFGFYLYPPVLAGLVAPVAAVWPGSPQSAGLVFAVVSFGSAVSGVVAVGRVEGVVGRGWRVPIVVAGLMWIYPPITETVITGNVELFEIAAFAWAWVAWRSGRSAVAGVLIGLTVLIKLQPILLLVWLAARADRRSFAWAVATIVAVPIALLPITGTADWFRFPTALSNLVAGGSTPIPSPTAILGTFLPQVVVRVGLLVLGAAVVWVLSRRSAAVGFAAAIVGGVLLSPLVWQRYLALEWLPFVLLWPNARLRPAIVVAYLLAWGFSPGFTTAAGGLISIVPLTANLVVVWWLLGRDWQTSRAEAAA